MAADRVAVAVPAAVVPEDGVPPGELPRGAVPHHEPGGAGEVEHNFVECMYTKERTESFSRRHCQSTLEL